MEWLVIILMMCDRPIDYTLFNVETGVYLEHVTKKEISKIIKEDKTKAITIHPMKNLYCV